jgi:predicted secreted protein
MNQLLDIEASEQALKARLANTFNTGYNAAQARFPKCDKDLKAQMAQLAQQGQALSQALAKP